MSIIGFMSCIRKKVNEYKFLILRFWWEEYINWDWAFFSMHILPIIKVPDIDEWMNVYFSQIRYSKVHEVQNKIYIQVYYIYSEF